MDVNELATSLDIGWTLLAAALVFFMQAGFAMVETGFTRAKNAGNIIMKNLMDFCLGTIVFWLLGFGIMFGALNPFFGGIELFGDGAVGVGYNWTQLIFQTVFCATAATIVSGAMAERTKFISYCLYSLIISAFVYPVSGHWIWGGGWLAEMGFHDFAGSCAVHMVGGMAALIGAMILGPRIGKYSEDGKVHAIPGHSLTLGALGVFILWFAWFGFNGGSTTALSGGSAEVAARVFVTTNMATAVAATTVMLITWLRYKKPDVSMTLNGALAGLVAITAGSDTVTTAGAAVIGLVAGCAVVFGIEFIDKTLKIDDPVGAIGVHGVCGALGTIMVGLFAYYDYGSVEVMPRGLFYGGGASALLTQLIGVVSVIAWVVVTMLVIFTIINKTVGLRVSAEEEIAGLDIKEHGLISSYADFTPVAHAIYEDTEPAPTPVPAVRVVSAEAAEYGPMSKVVIITRRTKFDLLKNALTDIGVTGMTVTDVMGCGLQKGATEYYRGVALETKLVPKVKVEVVVAKVPVAAIVEAAKRVLYTGSYGDGKIFVYDVKDVIQVRTGKTGYDALQYPEIDA